MNTFMHGPRFFSFQFSLFSISFPKLTIFTILRLYMACKMWKITALTWEISILRLVKKIPYLRFPHELFSIQLDWRARKHKTKNKKIFASNPEKRTQKQAQKDMNEMKWNDINWTIWYFQQCACVNAIYFAPVVTTTNRMKNNMGSEPWNECAC